MNLKSNEYINLQILPSLNTTRTIIIGLGTNNEEIFTIKKSYRHPYYEPPIIYNDIAISQLERRVNYLYWQSQQPPICLADSDDEYVNQEALIQGHGLTEKGKYDYVSS